MPDHIQPYLPPILSSRMLDQMHQAALRVLRNTGLQLPYPELKNKLCAVSGVRRLGDRICFDEELVDGFIREYRAEQKSLAQSISNDPIMLNVVAHTHHIAASDTGTVRPLTCADLIAATRLVDMLYDRGVRGSTPGLPQDVPAALQTLMQYKIGCEYSRHGGGLAKQATAQGFDYLQEMMKVMLGDKPVLPAAGVYMLSPLRAEGESFETCLSLINRGVILLGGVHIGNMPIAGLNAPLHPVGALVQSMAEVMGGFVIMKLLTRDHRIPVNFSVNAYAVDMKTAAMVYGSPEHNLIDLMHLAVNRYYGRATSDGRFIRTMAKQPGIQAAVETAASALIGAIAGVKFFNGAGALSLDEVFSPEHLVICCEIRDYAQRVRDGFEWSSDCFSESIIHEVAISGEDFITHPSTAADYRSVYWMPSLLERTTLAQWQYQPEPDVLAKAGTIVRQLVAAHDYELDQDRKKELDRIYKHAVRALG